jgi:hypothetical protein
MLPGRFVRKFVAFVTGQADAKGMRERKGGNARSVGLGGQEGKAPEKKTARTV